MSAAECTNYGVRIGLEVSIDNLVLFASLKHRGKRKNGQRKPAILRFAEPRVIENDHSASTAFGTSVSV
jgi:hypothetical protein